MNGMRLRQTILSGILATFTFISSSFSQDLQPGYVTLGLNGGLSFQSSDIQARFNGYGFGITLGKNLYYHPASSFTADIRGRFLYARQYGLDGERSFDINNNVSLNGQFGPDYLNYPPDLGVSPGFVYQNHRTSLGEVAAEGVLTWNTNRLGPGFFLSLYGGIGIYYFQTRIDQTDAFDEPYYEAYAQLDGRRGQIRRELRSEVLDGSFEAVADNLNRSGTANLGPSAGIEAGIQLTPNFALLAGHRITFSGDNLLDGHQWADAKGDWYHYTSLGMVWTLQRARRQTRGKGPEILINYPKPLPYTTSSSHGLVKARITGVQSPSDIVCSVNGSPMPFDFYSGDFAVSFPLIPGRNTVNIQATNPYGRDLKSALLIYQTGGSTITPPPPPPPMPNPNPIPSPNPIPAPTPDPPVARPTVKITQPGSATSTTQKPTASIRATLTGVSRASDITYQVNGRKISGFDYNPSTGILTHLLTLSEGPNEVVVKGVNAKGSAQASVKIIFEKPSTPPPPPPPVPKPPDVRIDEPANQAVVNTTTVTVRATLTHISSKDQITFMVNNSTTGNFTYSGGKFQASAPLRQGANTIRIVAKNTDGQDDATIQVSYQLPPKPKPVITFTQPSKTGSAALKASYEVKANIQHVANAEDITFLLNGKSFTNFNYANGKFSAMITLAEGRNNLEIKANNASGEATATTFVNYRKPSKVSPGAKPKVTITLVSQPASNPLNPNVASSTLEAVIEHVDRREQISFTINGRPGGNFEFDPATGAFKAVLTLERGSNRVEVKAATRAGAAQDERVIDF